MAILAVTSPFKGTIIADGQQCEIQWWSIDDPLATNGDNDSFGDNGASGLAMLTMVI